MRDDTNQQAKKMTLFTRLHDWWLVVPAAFAFGASITGTLVLPLETALPVVVCIPLSFAWLRTSYVSCAAAQAGDKLASSFQVEVYLASLLLVFPVVVTVCFAALVGVAFGSDLQHNAIRFSKIDATLATMYGLMFAAMLLSIWSPWLQGNRSVVRRRILAENLSDAKPDETATALVRTVPASKLSLRFELRTMLFLIALISVHLALGMTAVGIMLGLDYLLILSWISGNEVLRHRRDRQSLQSIDRLSVYWDQFVSYAGAVVLAGLVAISIRELLSGVIPWHSQLFGRITIPASDAIAVCGGITTATCWWLWARWRRSRPTLLESDAAEQP